MKYLLQRNRFWRHLPTYPLIFLAVIPIMILDLWVGAYMGATSATITWTLLLGLVTVPGVVFFPLRSIYAILLTTALSLTVWQERIRRPGVLGLAAAMGAVWCLSRGPG